MPGTHWHLSGGENFVHTMWMTINERWALAVCTTEAGPKSTHDREKTRWLKKGNILDKWLQLWLIQVKISPLSSVVRGVLIFFLKKDDNPHLRIDGCTQSFIKKKPGKPINSNC
jgi:hypothetical protein